MNPALAPWKIKQKLSEILAAPYDDISLRESSLPFRIHVYDKDKYAGIINYLFEGKETIFCFTRAGKVPIKFSIVTEL